MLELISYFNFVLALTISAAYFYQLVYLMYGLVSLRKPWIFVAQKQHRYAVMISARNEEEVIGELIGSLTSQNYPRELLDSLLGREPGTCTGPAEEEEPDLFGEVSPEEQERAGALYRWIKKHRAQSLEDLAGAFPWPLAVLSTLLLELELGGRIRRNSRNRYSAL